MPKYILENLAFKSFLYSLSKKTIREAKKVLVSSTVLKICFKSFFKYLAVEKVVKNFRAELKARYGVVLKAKGHSNSFILLITKEKAFYVVFKKAIRATEA